MKSKAIIPMLVGVGIGLLALKMGWNYIEKSRLSAAASQGDTPVVVASRSVSPGTPIQLADLKTVQWPRSAVPGEAYADPQKLVGRVNQAPLSADLPILEPMLTPPGTTPGLPALIPSGYLAMAVKVDEFSGVGGFLKPGDKVDVVATFNVKRAKSGPTKTVTRTILQNVTISAVGQVKEPGENNQPIIVRSVTLLVKPRQAQWLSMASSRGTIRLSLRSGRGADSTSTLSAITFEELLRGKAEEEIS
ncbi:MAG: Flp pilus assembly protein CpaB, partial [Phycisphaerae bacterium]|nr:Flp pilus assembly protein CpaB [Phycisphaerae bacterium]